LRDLSSWAAQLHSHQSASQCPSRDTTVSPLPCNNTYLNALNATRAASHDLTLFLKFALKGIESQCRRLFGEIRQQVAKALYRNTVTDPFGRLKSPRKRVVSARHVQLLNLLLDEEAMTLAALTERTRHIFIVSNPYKALVRDLNYLISMGAIAAKRLRDTSGFLISINLDWPAKITETEFSQRVKAMPKGKVYGFLSA
jgi:hypothetical protein